MKISVFLKSLDITKSDDTNHVCFSELKFFTPWQCSQKLNSEEDKVGPHWMTVGYWNLNQGLGM